MANGKSALDFPDSPSIACVGEPILQFKDPPGLPLSGSSPLALEDGAAFSRPRRRIPLWRKMLMTVRRRRNGGENGIRLEDSTRKPRDMNVSRRARRCRLNSWNVLFVCICLPILVFAVFGFIHVADFVLGLRSALWDVDDFSSTQSPKFWPEWGQAGGPGEQVVHYPTDATRDVLPIPCHSHNDYWRRIPFYEAVHYGCTGVEADVWLFDDELFVGHNTASLTRERTFRSLYVNPIVEMLDKQNPSTEFGSTTNHGIFDEDPSQTLVLLVDFKNSGSAILPFVQEQLGALRDGGYLTHFNGTDVVQGQVTVVATGNAPYDLIVQNTTYRDIFFDAPLSRMISDPSLTAPDEPSSDAGQGSSGLPSWAVFDETNAYYASVSFTQSIGHLWRFRLTETQIEKIRAQIRGAHARGLKARYWDTPSWPVGLRNHVWEVLVREGADYLNVDDLKAATRMDWRQRKFQWWK